MKILANREALLSAMQAVWGVVPTRSPKPILSNVKIVVSHDGTTLTGTDLEVGLIRRVVGVKVEEPGAAILSARVLEILKSSRDEELSIETTEAGLRVRGLHADFKLTGDDPDLFPTVAEFNADDYYKVASADLKRAIRRTIFAIDEESTRYAMGGLLWEMRGQVMVVAATDGRRLAECMIPSDYEGAPPALVNGEKDNPAPIIPGKAMKLLERSLSDDDTPVHISINPKSHALIWADDLTVYTRLVEGRFPKYQDAFPEEPGQKLTVSARELLNGINQAKIVTSEESRGVDFQFTASNLTLSAQGSDAGAATIELPFSLGGDPLTITFDPHYLDTMLRVLGDDQEVTLNLISDKHPMVVELGNPQHESIDGYRYVAMPLTRDR